MEPLLTIDEVARRTGLTAHTLRYYERIGLIAPVARAPGGQRRYAASDLAWIGFLLRLRETGMPIGQMLAFAELRGEGDATVPERRRLLQAHLAEVQASIAAMRRSARALQAKIAHYRQVERSLPPSPEPEATPDDTDDPADAPHRATRPRQRTLPKRPRPAA